MDLFCSVLEVLLLVLSVAIERNWLAGDEGKDGRDPVLDRPEEALEFVDCMVCGKPNQAGRVSCSACGALQEAART